MFDAIKDNNIRILLYIFNQYEYKVINITTIVVISTIKISIAIACKHLKFIRNFILMLSRILIPKWEFLDT